MSALLVTLIGVSCALADGDPQRGKKVFNKCRACHDVGPEARNKVGPVLNGLVGQAWGRVPDYKYSKALLEQAALGRIWDIDTLSAYLTKPRAVIKKGKMAFAGLRKQRDIDDVIAYMASFGPDGNAVNGAQ